jgi:hypothetical protein
MPTKKPTGKWLIHERRGPDFRQTLELMNADLMLPKRERRCFVQVRGCGKPQRVAVDVPYGRLLRVTLKTGIDLFRAVANGERIAIQPADVSRFEMLYDSEWEQANAVKEYLITGILTGRFQEISVEDFMKAWRLDADQFARMRREEPDLFRGPMLSCALLRQWFDTLPAKVRQGVGQ